GCGASHRCGSSAPPRRRAVRRACCARWPALGPLRGRSAGAWARGTPSSDVQSGQGLAGQSGGQQGLAGRESLAEVAPVGDDEDFVFWGERESAGGGLVVVGAVVVDAVGA